MSDEEEMASISVWRNPLYAHTFPDACEQDDELFDELSRQIVHVEDLATRRVFRNLLALLKDLTDDLDEARAQVRALSR